MGVASCGITEGTESPFEADENDDSVSFGAADNGGGSQATCAVRTSPMYALGGRILAPTSAMTGYVLVQDEKIVNVVTSLSAVPADAIIIDTGGIISAGFVDLHNHVNYDFIPLWQANERWQNRYEWSNEAGYRAAVKTPYNAVKNARALCQAIKYGEIRALIGGTTTVQGTTDYQCVRAWVRNVEHTNFCEDHVRQNVLPLTAMGQEDANKLIAQFESGATRAYLVHLAEGIDDLSRNEFEHLRELDLLRPQVVGIHSTALTESQLAEMGQIGMKIVWSPLSNMILYGQTTNIPAALRSNVKVALAPDWSPSGSANMLWELKVADRIDSEKFGNVITPRETWRMATQYPAEIVGMGDKVGKIAPGYYADLVVIRGSLRSPYDGIIRAKPQDVLLTMIGGEPLYGTESLMNAFGKGATDYEIVDACGEPRALDISDTRVPGGDETLADITTKLTGITGQAPIPLFQCSGAPEWAFSPTPAPNP